MPSLHPGNGEQHSLLPEQLAPGGSQHCPAVVQINVPQQSPASHACPAMAQGGPRPPVVVRAAPDVPVEEPVRPVVPWPPVLLPFEPELLAVPPVEPELLAVPPVDPLVIVDEPLGDEPPDPEVPLFPDALDRQQPPSSIRIASAMILVATITREWTTNG